MSRAEANRPVTIESRAELDELLASNPRVLVMVRTAGCAICKSMDPIIDNVARATDVAVVDFNPKADLDAVAEFDVRSVPTFLLFDDGDLIDRMADGFVPTEDLVAFVER
ncbi:thioredoxin family protein [Halomicroarcula sp. GCM10025324]|uniref:thioredoxin family protein n=1 Tax=Haloarcula TaxID=2237 RepID=UPI0023E8F9BB|nr:thioredoxin family protein [Halomicroarcula sp. ZS-22-S1]